MATHRFEDLSTFRALQSQVEEVTCLVGGLRVSIEHKLNGSWSQFSNLNSQLSFSIGFHFAMGKEKSGSMCWSNISPDRIG